MCLEVLSIQQYILQKFTPFKSSECAYQINFTDEQSCQPNITTATTPHAQQKCPKLSFPFARSALITAPLKSVETLVAPTTLQKRVQELTFDLTELDASTRDFQPGDTIGILPRNSAIAVETICDALQLRDKMHDVSYITESPLSAKDCKGVKVPTHIPALFTPFELLSDCLDLQAVPKKKFLRRLADRCTDPEEERFFSCLSSKEGTMHYDALFLKKGLTLLDLLETCATCLPTLGDLIECLPRLLPRPYSIANSNLTEAKELKIIYSILPQKAGITTSMLDELSEKLTTAEILPRVQIFLREPTKFRYTESEIYCSQILIGVGTGLAPFFGFLQYKQDVINTNNDFQSMGQTWLFAGARLEASVLHRKRIQTWQASGMLNKYIECLSKEPGSTFSYVQDAIAANAKDLVQLLMQSKASIYVCGGVQVSETVRCAVRKCLAEQLNIDDSQANEMMKEFQLKGKYREDIWR